MKFIDSHAHLDFEDFHKDFDAVLERAEKAGVEKIINIGADIERSRAAVLLAENYEHIYATVGVHPDEAKNVDFDIVKDELERLTKSSKKVVGIGECGLDYFRLESPQEKQLQHDLFKLHIELAMRHSLPLVVHVRNGEDSAAFTDTVKILDEYGYYKGVIHCFTLGPVEAKVFVDHGLKLGFTGIITYKNANEIREAVEGIDLSDILIETDCPFLAPQKYRGERNEPAYVVEVAKEVARVKSTDLTDVALQTTKNVLDLFHI